MWAWYNEIDEYAADWLENLIARGLIAPGVVDRRSIEDVRPDDLRGFRQCHFFAGIGVWSYSLRRSGVSDDTALWTGSCPCQPFSAAGQGGGVDDERHLWPHWFHLIRECRPDRVYGEQVASKDGLGWLDLVWSDLEEAGYAIRPTDTCSAGSGAPHIRQRLRFRADNLRPATSGLQHASRDRWIEGWPEPSRGSVVDMGNTECLERIGRWSGEAVPEPGTIERIERSDSVVRLGDGDGARSLPSAFGRIYRGEEGTGPWDGEPERSSSPFRLDDDDDDAGLEGLGHGHRASAGQRQGSLRPVATAGGIEWVADDDDQQRPRGETGICDVDDARGRDEGAAAVAGLHGSSRLPDADGGNTGAEWQQRGGEQRQQQANGGGVYRTAPNWTGPTNGFWRDADWLFCRDGKWRPVEPGTFPLVDGVAFRMGSGSAFEGKSRQGMLKGYGNAIDAEATIDFITACLESEWTDIDGERVRLTEVSRLSSDMGVFG